MNVRMRYFQTNHCFTYFLARESLLNGTSHLLGENMHCCQIFIIQIKDIIHFLLGNDQRVPFHQRIDVQKCKELIILRHLIAWYFTCDNSTEYCCHNFYDI